MAAASIGAICAVGLMSGSALAAVPSGNLIVNGNAETGVGASDSTTVSAVPGWSTSGAFTEHTYDPAGSTQFPDANLSAGIGGGAQLFAGGPDAASSVATQTIDVSSAAAEIDANQVTATLSGYLGGYADQDDDAEVAAAFYGASQRAPLGQVTIGPVNAADRSNATNLLLRQASIAAPSGTRSVRLAITMTRVSGTYNDGYADNISLTLTKPPPPPPGSAPVNQTPPVMTGAPTPGSTLTCNPGVWGGAQSTYRQFLRSDAGGTFQPISPAAGTYTVTSGDTGSRFRCQEVATNSNGVVQAFSNIKTVAAGVPVVAQPPSITGAALGGNPLSCNPGTWNNSPSSFVYRWLRDGQAILKATGPEYVVRAGTDDQQHLTCEVTAVNDVGDSAPATSAAVVALDGPPRNDGPPSLVIRPGPNPYGIATCLPGVWHDDTGTPHSFRIQMAGTTNVLAAGPTLSINSDEIGEQFTCTETVSNFAGTNEATSAPLLIQPHSVLSVHVDGIEVTQAVQTIGQPTVSDYTGVKLIKDRKTVVKVFVSLRGSPAANESLPQHAPIGITLYGDDGNGHSLALSPIAPESSPPQNNLTLNPASFLTGDRLSSAQNFTFVLPDDWTEHGPISLAAKTVASNSTSGVANKLCLRTSCGAVPTAVLRSVGFTEPPPPWVINVLGIIAYNPTTQASLGPLPPPDAPFVKLAAISPVPFKFTAPDGTLTDTPVYRGYRTSPSNQILQTAQSYDLAIDQAGDGTFGIFDFQPGNGITVGRVSVGTADQNAAGQVNRPITVIAHELFHQLGLQHADTVCGGGGDGIPDAFGHMVSVGTDTTGSAPYRVIGPTGFDLMSYCGLVQGDPNHWISLINWTRLLIAHPSADRSHAVVSSADAGAAAAGNSLTVIGTINTSGGQITSVSAGQSGGLSLPSTSAYTLVARNAAGQVVSSAPMIAQRELDDPRASVSVEGRVPGTGITRVEIVSHGAVLAARNRSASAPRATILSPGAGASVGRGGSVTVRWNASDADHDPLQITLDISSNGGRSFHNIYAGQNTGKVKLPYALLPSSRKARLRLTVNDGFNETTVSSRVFSIAPRPPTVVILEPLKGGHLDGGSIVFLRGGATDDHGHPIKGRGLRWVADGRTLGYGEQVTAPIPAGARQIRLLARDEAGLTASASATIRAPASTPFFLKLSGPSRLSARARQITIVVAATENATLRVNGHRFAVGRKAHRLRIPIKPGHGSFTLHLTLTSGSKRTSETFAVRRRQKRSRSLAGTWKAGSTVSCDRMTPWWNGRYVPPGGAFQVQKLAFALMAAINGSTGSCATLSHGL